MPMLQYTLLNLGGYYLPDKASGIIDSSIHYYKLSLDLAQELGEPRSIISSLIELGFAYFYNTELDKTESYLLQALELTNTISDDMYRKFDKAKALNNLAIVYNQKK